MVLPDFLRKSRASKEDGEEAKRETYKVDLPYKHDTATNANGKAKLRAKWITRVVVVLIVLGALTVAAVAFVHRESRGAEKYVGCDLYLHKYVHKGKVIHVNESHQVKIQCDEGYKLIGSPVVECLPSGHWSQTPTCVSKECKHFPVPEHADVKLKKVASSIMQELKVSCHEGYLLQGNRTIVCQSDETWSQVPVCNPVDCGDPADVENGKIENLNETTYNNTFQVECNDGYYLGKGNETVKCESDGEWDESPECAPLSCGMPTNPNHARIFNIEGTVFKKTVEFQCVAGFQMKGNPTITCLSKGEWSPSPVCERVDCGYPPHINNGRIKNLQDTVYNSAFNVECYNGYVLKGSETVKCESSAKWDDMPVCERVSCGIPDIPYHADILVMGGTTFEMSVTFKCTARYRLKGNPEVTCLSNGKWTENPTCEYISDPCYSNPCYSGHCVATGYSYTCTSSNTKSSGFSGIFCEPISKKFSLLFVSILVFQVFMNF